GNGVWVNDGSSLTLNMRNVLMANVVTNLNMLGLSGGASISAENVTFANPTYNGYPNPYTLIGQGSVTSWGMTFINCILVNMNDSSFISGHFTASYNGFYPNYSAFGSPSFGARSYYLTNGNCSFRNLGTTNIDPALLADLQQRTTYPPMVLSNTTVTVNT